MRTTDGRTDRRTRWFQYTPPNFVAGGINIQDLSFQPPPPHFPVSLYWRESTCHPILISKRDTFVSESTVQYLCIPSDSQLNTEYDHDWWTTHEYEHEMACFKMNSEELFMISNITKRKIQSDLNFIIQWLIKVFRKYIHLQKCVTSNFSIILK